MKPQWFTLYEEWDARPQGHILCATRGLTGQARQQSCRVASLIEVLLQFALDEYPASATISILQVIDLDDRGRQVCLVAVAPNQSFHLRVYGSGRPLAEIDINGA